MEVKMDYREILSRFSYESDREITERIENRDVNNITENQDIINQIVLWKLSRSVHLKDETINRLNKLSYIARTPIDVVENKEIQELILDLLESKGIRLPVASTILHFYCPNVFPIIDQRAFRELTGFEFKSSTNENNILLYLDYIKKCEEYRKINYPEMEFYHVDKILYQLDKEKGLKVKY